MGAIGVMMNTITNIRDFTVGAIFVATTKPPAMMARQHTIKMTKIGAYAKRIIIWITAITPALDVHVMDIPAKIICHYQSAI